MKKEHNYTDDKVIKLSDIEHCRTRFGMYGGRLGDGSNPADGIYAIAHEIFSNSIDEFISGFGEIIEIEVTKKSLSCQDHGRGIPLSKLEEVYTQLNTGAKFNDDVFQFSVGMNGVGGTVSNAVSKKFIAKSVRDNKFVQVEFSRGILQNKTEGKTKEEDGTYVYFEPDDEIFPKYKFNLDFIEDRIKNYSYLYSGLKIIYNKKEYFSNNGLLDLINNLAPKPNLYDPIYFKNDHIEFTFTHNNEYSDGYRSYVNGNYTDAGGTHLVAYREAITRGINGALGKNYKTDDIREGLYACIAIKIKDVVFESQTKNRLGSEVKSWLVPECSAAIESYLRKNPETAKALEDKILFNESLRTQLNDVKKSAKEASKRTSLRIEKLKDCKYHRGESKQDTMIFLTEGDSAGGTMTPVRDVTHQAIFMLRGKPENMYGMKKADIYKNKELYNLMSTLGIENSIDDLRYDRIVIASDQDDDGLHIRNLLLTFFLTFFPDLVNKGFLYILETPLFKLEQKEKRLFAYSIKERDDLLSKNKGNWEITRAKGLGEWNPKEMAVFINPDTIKLGKITINSKTKLAEILKLYSGSNTPERKELIIKHLHDVEISE